MAGWTGYEEGWRWLGLGACIGGIGLWVRRAVKKGDGGWAWGLALVALDGGWDGLWKKGGGVGPGGCWLG